MGLASLAAASNLRSPNIAALQAIGGTTGGASATDLIWRMRMKCDGLLGLAAYTDVGLGQVDDGTDANAKTRLFGVVGSTLGTMAFHFSIGATGGGWNTPTYTPGSYAHFAAGRYLVLLMWYLESTFTRGYAIYDDTGTGTLMDGLAPGTSVFQATSTYNSPYPIIAGNGQVAVNYAASCSRLAQVYDSLYLLNALPTADAVPSTGILAKFLFDDTPAQVAANSGFASTVPSTPVYAVISGTATAIAGGAEAAQTYTPTTVVGTPSAPSCAANGTVQLVPATQDQYGATGTLTPTTRTYNYSIVSGSTYATVSGSGLVSGANAGAGTTVISVTDSAAGGGSATAWVVSVTVTATTGTLYSATSSAPSVATTTTGFLGAVGESITDVTQGTAVMTVTREGTSLSCTISVVSAGSGSSGFANEPSGMTPQINTGDMTTPPNQTGGGGTWTEGSTIVTTFQNYTNPVVPAPPYNAGNVYTNPALIALAPDGPGIEVEYNTLCLGQNNPVGWQAGGMSAKANGLMFLSFLVRARFWSNISDPNGAQIVGPKMMEPRCGQNGENHVIQAEAVSGTDNYLAFYAQGPTEDYPRNDQAPYSGVAVYTPNADLQFNQNVTWRWCQMLLGQETTPGTSNDAYLKWWVGPKGGSLVLAYDSTQTGAGSGAGTWLAVPGFNLLIAGSTKGWFDLVFNQTYGGAPVNSTVPNIMYLGLNQLYVSQR